MIGSCFACANAAERACTHCGRLFCPEHGKVGATGVAVCGACLSAQKRVWKVIAIVALAGLALWGLYRAFS